MAGRGYILVDGYNIIFATKELADIAGFSLDAARRKLCDILCDFKGAINERVIAVFDAHLVEGGVGSVETYNNIMLVFTKEAETADHYIERTAQKLIKHERVTVATSDRLEQTIIVGQGAMRVSAQDFWTDVENAREGIRARYIKRHRIKKNPIETFLDEDTARKLDAMRYE